MKVAALSLQAFMLSSAKTYMGADDRRLPEVYVTTASRKLASFLSELIAPILVDPDQFNVSYSRMGDGVEFVIELAPDALQKLGGMSGKTCIALRTIVRAEGIKQQTLYDLRFHSTMFDIPESDRVHDRSGYRGQSGSSNIETSA
jgi:predicted RNA-binding protein YlqC (UPF0109 family)